MKYKLDWKIKQGIISIVGGYVVFSALWIFLTDSALASILSDVPDIRNISIIKGMLFVIVTATLLFVMMAKYAHALNNIYTELKEEQIRFDAVLIMSKQGYYELDLNSKKASASPGYWMMLGYDQCMPCLTLEWWQESLHPDDRENAVNTLTRCMNGEISEYKIRYRLKAKTGGWKSILSTGMVVQYKIDGKPERMVGMHTDIEYMNTL